jgi:hypothetical protein
MGNNCISSFSPALVHCYGHSSGLRAKIPRFQASSWTALLPLPAAIDRPVHSRELQTQGRPQRNSQREGCNLYLCTLGNSQRDIVQKQYWEYNQ